MTKQPAIYILASQPNGTLYIGATSNLPQRIYQHQHGLIEGFTKKYHVKILVYFELYQDMITAIEREKSLKGVTRHKKIALIESENPKWEDLAIKFDIFKS
ncbi:MAG TPA: GIY-YIG nuclease family protein [Methylotenera sp.]|nr:GIY-YIG nuclease family protein [Methylotenera sp.]